MKLTYSKYDIGAGVQKIKTRIGIFVSAIALLAGGSGLSLALLGTTHADSLNSINFENPPYVLGNINNQQGWSKTGPFDATIVDNAVYGYSGLGNQSLRISNSTTSGSFGDQTYSPSLLNEAGETDALNDGQSGGKRQPHFEAQFTLASTTKTNAGMALSVSPDRGDGARMSYLRFEDQAEGIRVFFDDVVGTTGNGKANFREIPIATLSYTMTHTVKFSMDFLNGPSNDVVRVYIDGKLAETGTSWEDYYRFDTESNPGLTQNNSRTVDSLLFREAGTANFANLGKGYLVDNASLLSGPMPRNFVAPSSKDQCTNNGWNNFGLSFKNQGDCVSYVATKGKNQPTNPFKSHSAIGNVTLASPVQTLSFVTYDNGGSASDQGTVTYSNLSAGLTYTVPVTCVNVTNNTTYFSYQIPNSAPVAPNVWVVWKVVDNGSTDTAGFTTVANGPSAAALCEAGTAGVTDYPITAGNIVVQ